MALVAVLSISSADAVTLCAKKSGKIVARDACKRRETSALPGAIVVVGPTGPQGAAGPAGVPGIIPHEVIDSTGKQFGTLLGWEGGRAQVVAAVPGVDVPLQFNIDGGAFQNFPGDAIFYETPGCSGTPLLLDSGGLVPLVHVFGTRAYFSRTVLSMHPIASQEGVPSTPGSCGSGTDTGRQTCCFGATGQIFRSPAESFDLILLGVTPPFSVVPR